MTKPRGKQQDVIEKNSEIRRRNSKNVGDEAKPMERMLPYAGSNGYVESYNATVDRVNRERGFDGDC